MQKPSVMQDYISMHCDEHVKADALGEATCQALGTIMQRSLFASGLVIMPERIEVVIVADSIPNIYFGPCTHTKSKTRLQGRQCIHT